MDNKKNITLTIIGAATLLVMVIGATIIYELGYYTLRGLILGFEFEWLNFIFFLLQISLKFLHLLQLLTQKH